MADESIQQKTYRLLREIGDSKGAAPIAFQDCIDTPIFKCICGVVERALEEARKAPVCH